MSQALKLERGRIVEGVWEGLVSGAGDCAPVVEALHEGRALDGVEVRAVPGRPGSFALRLPIPARVLNDGTQTVLVRSGDTVLAQVTLVAGQPPEGDIRAELDLLRAELDLLKRAFQRHVREG